MGITTPHHQSPLRPLRWNGYGFAPFIDAPVDGQLSRRECRIGVRIWGDSSTPPEESIASPRLQLCGEPVGGQSSEDLAKEFDRAQRKNFLWKDNRKKARGCLVLLRLRGRGQVADQTAEEFAEESDRLEKPFFGRWQWAKDARMSIISRLSAFSASTTPPPKRLRETKGGSKGRCYAPERGSAMFRVSVRMR